MEQAAFQPNNMVPGIALSPDKMLLARVFSYGDAHRARLGVNYEQIPVNSPKVPCTATARTVRCGSSTCPTRCTLRTPRAARRRTASTTKPVGWYADGEIVRAAYILHAEDDDWGQPGMLVREVMDDAARERLVSNIVGHLLAGVTEPVLQRAFGYWRNVDKSLGDKMKARRAHAKQG